MPKYGLLDPGTCLPVLEAICHVLEIEKALEFGCGIWSTFCLTRNCNTLTSIEQRLEWVKKVKKDYKHKGNLNIIHWTKPFNEYFMENEENYDLIFIDGEDRIECLNDAFGRSPIIVCHDTHQPSFNWYNTNLPNDYTMITYTGCQPYLTTVFYHRDLDLKNILLDPNNYKYKGTFIEDNFWTDQNMIEYYKQQIK